MFLLNTHAESSPPIVCLCEEPVIYNCLVFVAIASMDDNGLFQKPSSHDPPVYRPTITETFGLHHFPQGVYELQHDWCTVIISNDNAPLVQGLFSPETGQPWTLTLLLINIYLMQSVYNPYKKVCFWLYWLVLVQSGIVMPRCSCVLFLSRPSTRHGCEQEIRWTVQANVPLSHDYTAWDDVSITERQSSVCWRQWVTVCRKIVYTLNLTFTLKL